MEIVIYTTDTDSIKLGQDETNTNLFELVKENYSQLTLHELSTLNTLGFVYHHSDIEVDYEDTDEDGNIITGLMMDIHYFAKVDNVEYLFRDCEL